ncbi:MAG TPA: hypothetical protein VH562_05965 [Nitrosopumilaceae archaeon]|jgi:hypothetical protein
MGIKSKIQGTEDFIKKKASFRKNNVSFVKEIMASVENVFLKTDAIAILIKRTGESKIFFEAFDKITREGYDLKSQEPIIDPIPKINMTLGYIFYFQNKKYIT